MIRGLLAQKIGMTQIFDKEGNVIPVTVLNAGPCTVLELPAAPPRVKVGFGEVKENRLRKPVLGYFKKVGVRPFRHVREFESTDNKDYKVGQEITVDVFRPGDFVDVTGISRGKGFQGGMKRWHWHGGPAAHGSMHHRRIGSISASTDPSRTFLGHHMPGHMGSHNVTVEGLRVIQIDKENNLLMLKGTVPGSRHGLIAVRLSRKKAYKSLEEKKAVVVKKKNPMKQSKSKAAGKA